jgi:hypothetical protein
MGRKKPPIEEEEFEQEEEPTSSGILSRWSRRLVMLGIVGAAGVVSAPTVISTLGLADTVAAPWIPKGINVHLGKTDLAWWSPVRLNDVHVTTTDGSLDVQVKKVRSSGTLLGLAMSPMKWGTIHLESPTIACKVSPTPASQSIEENTKEEGAKGRWLSALPAELRGTIEATGGSIQVDDGLGGTWSLAEVEGKIDVAPDRETAIAGNVAGVMADNKNATMKGAISISREGRSRGDLAATNFPLGMLNPILAWSGENSKLGGSLTGQAEFDDDIDRLQIKTDGEIQDFVLASELIAPDRLSLRQLDTQVTLAMKGSSLRIDQGSVRCDVGEASATGTVDLSKMSDPAAQNLIVEGLVDLPTLADRLPHLVRIREDVTIESGKLALSIRPAADVAGRWDGVSEVREFRARRGAKPIEWPKPVSVTARGGRNGEGAVVVDQFQCESDFLRAKGSGTLSSFDVSAVCDLSRLQDRIGELLDLGDTRFAGRFSGRVQSSENHQGGIALRGAAKAEGLEVRVDGETLLAEPQLQGQFQLTSADKSLAEIIEGAVVLKNDREHLNAHLVDGVKDWKKGPWGTWEIQASGDLAELVRRGGSISPNLAEIKAAGVGVISGRFQFTAGQTQFDRLIVDMQGLVYATPTMRVADKRIRLETSGTWNGDDLAIALGPTSLLGETIQFRTDRLRGKLTEDGLAVACKADVAGDLGAIRGWTQVPPAPVDLAGQFQGVIGLESDGKRWGTTVNGTINDFRYGAVDAPTIDEPKVELAGRASSGSESQGWLLQDFRVAVPGLSVTASGSMTELSAQQVVDLEGLIEYDWGPLSPRLRGLLGDQIVFEGRDRRAFRLSGPMAAGSKMEFAAARDTAVGQYPGLKGEFSLGWERARLYGFAAGPANIDGKLTDSWIVTQPVSFPLNQGKVELRPGLFFATHATYLHHPAGRVAERVVLTREMCEGALQYIAPVLADSVDVKGLVTVDLDEVKVPLGHFDQGDLSGRVRLEEAQATGGPLLKEILALTDGQPVVEISKDSEIRFRMSQGRVFHEGLQFRLPGMVIETSGFVGLDRRLELTAEMPIPPRWYPNEKIRERLSGQRLRVPIGGTLDQPRIDKQAFQRQAGRLLEESAGRLIEGELNKQIDKQLGKFLDKLK